MSNRKLYLLGGSLVLILLVLGFTDPKNPQDKFSETVKVSLRDIGHQLLLTHKDSTSLILPVIALENSKYRLSFERELSFDPSNLVSLIAKSFQKAALPKHYRVEVIQCIGKEVAYSYEMSSAEEKTIVPCRGRVLPESCYSIEIRFIEPVASLYSKQSFVYFLIFGLLAISGFFFYNKRSTNISRKESEPHTGIGSFRFYPEQNKLVKEAVEISLSKKECELLSIFVANPNQIIKRDELTKKVWEDNGVFVGRSLDTYISKLRKKLKGDDSIKLTNVHGVGYKLEITLNN